jgi:hypothetical protein
MADLPRVGEHFAGYLLLDMLGRGGMGVVYKAEHPRLGNEIALKVLAPEYADNDVFRTRFREESRIAANLKHPNVIPIHDFNSSTDGLLYIAMRYVEGTDLGALLKERDRLDPATAVFLLSQAARALDAARREALVHRDVTPGNLLIERGDDEADPDHLYLADFGITKLEAGRTALTSAGLAFGTADYISPEQAQGLSAYGAADQYSLGCVLYRCLTGRLPFERDLYTALLQAHAQEYPPPPTMFLPDLPPAIDAVFDRVLAKNPVDRYSSCREFMAAARDALQPTSQSWSGQVPGTAAEAGDRELAREQDVNGYDRTQSAGVPLAGLTDGQPFPAAAAASQAFHGYGDAGDLVPDAESPAYLGAAAYSDQAVQPERALYSGAEYPAADGMENTGPASFPGQADGAGGPWLPSALGAGSRPARRRRGRAVRLGPTVGIVAIAILAGAGIIIWLGMANGTVKQGAPTAATTSVLMSTIQQADTNTSAAGKMDMSTCKQSGPDAVVCTWPIPAIAQVTFLTYPTLNAMYNTYVENVVDTVNAGQKLHTGAYTFFSQKVQNSNACSAVAPQQFDESSWNQSGNNIMQYTSLDMAEGKAPEVDAEGRVFCYQSPSGSGDIYWTQDPGRMLVKVTGATSWLPVWKWFSAIHDYFVFPASASTLSPVPPSTGTP